MLVVSVVKGFVEVGAIFSFLAAVEQKFNFFAVGLMLLSLLGCEMNN